MTISMVPERENRPYGKRKSFISISHALVVQWLEQGSYTPQIMVRVHASVPFCFKYRLLISSLRHRYMKKSDGAWFC